MDTEEGQWGGKEEEEGGASGGRGCGPYIGAAQPPFDVVVGPTAFDLAVGPQRSVNRHFKRRLAACRRRP
jgi:hypothetical protein